MLVTSGLGEHYPAGYPVGQVVSVIKDPGMQFSTINIQPSSQADRTSEVLLVWPNQKNTDTQNLAAAALPEMKLDNGLKSNL